MDFAVGQVIGSHRVVRRLGSGGMSTVYEVEHVSLGVRSRRLPWLWFALGLVAALGVAVVAWRTGADAGETAPVPPDELFAVPAFAK